MALVLAEQHAALCCHSRGEWCTALPGLSSASKACRSSTRPDRDDLVYEHQDRAHSAMPYGELERSLIKRLGFNVPSPSNSTVPVMDDVLINAARAAVQSLVFGVWSMMRKVRLLTYSSFSYSRNASMVTGEGLGGRYAIRRCGLSSLG